MPARTEGEADDASRLSEVRRDRGRLVFFGNGRGDGRLSRSSSRDPATVSGRPARARAVLEGDARDEGGDVAEEVPVAARLAEGLDEADVLAVVEEEELARLRRVRVALRGRRRERADEERRVLRGDSARDEVARGHDARPHDVDAALAEGLGVLLEVEVAQELREVVEGLLRRRRERLLGRRRSRIRRLWRLGLQPRSPKLRVLPSPAWWDCPRPRPAIGGLTVSNGPK